MHSVADSSDDNLHLGAQDVWRMAFKCSMHTNKQTNKRILCNVHDLVMVMVVVAAAVWEHSAKLNYEVTERQLCEHRYERRKRNGDRAPMQWQCYCIRSMKCIWNSLSPICNAARINHTANQSIHRTKAYKSIDSSQSLFKIIFRFEVYLHAAESLTQRISSYCIYSHIQTQTHTHSHTHANK